MSLHHQIMQDSPRAYWPLNELSGTTAFDVSGNALHGTYTGAVTPSAVGPGGRSVLFNGAGQRMGAPSNALLNLGDVLSIECWVRRNSASDVTHSLFGKGDSAMVIRFLADNTLQCLKSHIGAPTTSTVLTIPDLTVFHHIAATKSAGAIPSIYVDGVLVSSGGTAGVFANGGNNWTLNSDQNSVGAYVEPGNQYISHAAVFPTVLSADRIKAHYEAGVRSGSMIG